MIKIARTTNPVMAAQSLFFTNSLIWLLFGFASLIRISPFGPVSSVTRWVIAALFGNAAAMLLAGLGLRKRSRLFYFFALAVLAANMLLTITDQFGWLDLITLVIDFVLCGVLISARSQFYTNATSRQRHIL